MTSSSFVRPTVALLAVAAFAACSKTTVETTPAPSTSPAPTAAVNTAPASLMMTASMVAQGDSMFHARTCVRCHGADAGGAKNGPSLKGPTFLHTGGQYNQIVRIITEGVPADSIKDKSHAFPMRARGGAAPLLSDPEIQAIAAYVYSLSHK